MWSTKKRPPDELELTDLSNEQLEKVLKDGFIKINGQWYKMERVWEVVHRKNTGEKIII